MRRVHPFVGPCVVLCLAALYGCERSSGLAVGEMVGAFNVVKVAGAVDDNVAVGEELCYRCKLGNRPVVMVFTRTAGEAVANLIQKIDAAVAEHADQQAASFVNFLGADASTLTSSAEQLAKSHDIQNVALVVPVDHENGPEAFALDPKAAVTVVLYKGSLVESRHDLAEGQLDAEQTESILAEAQRLWH